MDNAKLLLMAFGYLTAAHRGEVSLEVTKNSVQAWLEKTDTAKKQQRRLNGEMFKKWLRAGAEQILNEIVRLQLISEKKQKKPVQKRYHVHLRCRIGAPDEEEFAREAARNCNRFFLYGIDTEGGKPDISCRCCLVSQMGLCSVWEVVKDGTEILQEKRETDQVEEKTFQKKRQVA